MKKVYAFLALLMSSLLLFAACDQEKQEKKPEKPAMLEVKIEADDHIELNKETTIACVVTYGGEKVDDADEVKFEIWKHGSEQHDMLKAKNEGSGKYSVTKTFTEPGTYSVVAHVTARNMHNMPKKDIIVGQESKQHQEHGDNAGHGGHHHADLSIMLQHKEYAVNKPVSLTARIAHAGKPLTNAAVRFEVWKDSGKHEFIDASETQAGQYEAAATFQEKGTYSVKIHVEAKELHEHQIEQITVK
ncbi:FixH family protein [Parageobacillus thermoglucosidasius]|jgi:hypothetical protein|uniref:YtkA-like domain-containing protein n=1 Tax=Parageobacillus thermoglucosidasius TaxID=1426 RepID=A0A1B7KU57_PARTM|nr:FixH family protein [Parageobacillus thermoglucosidasius]OAT73563.1 hypothetical protein A7K69_06210 [Parageobacillus thermoglucosidasius]